ncbi:ATP synthase epsilon chain, sodium ion specific [Fusobacterium sp. DD29]|uniref:ATP synthase F1 subunit epsilon n=1 Tax=unclassified Fusobacterium TaxID=2648384 RepID=UPI001B8D9FDA|nr:MULTISPECIES: ATP synthase F1 subunit epsilon [unclassified Fusobacterium]MBR8700877.1 ATP synthase epsilon chain, sodium ion specific [Fusobacterium sp. DD45]MBR8710659.1 ATP synthase epsilon chain, sodium ion specific [Fusobacterium sp. DD28]MBR8748838.1 ATP synthase epsilon chain, sodium ion specific [Fusobacterium sp. DD29]MBR8751227.1 ATP synthase epsilon chain, sodium ion specific [Fusobacterium sp. DD26]MBR8761105.1 ATP synthase epsilon chain, sodium ion specific [Fusobacterium sp. D
MSTFKVKVVTYEQKVLAQEADFVLVRTTEGDMGILPNHAPFIAELSTGEMKIRLGNDEEKYFVSEGLLEISNNVVSIIATEAIPADMLDIERERREVERLKAKLAKLQEDKDILLTQKNLREALMKVHVAEKMM